MKTISRKPTLISMALEIAFCTTPAFISANADEMDYYESSSIFDTIPILTPSFDTRGIKTFDGIIK